MVLYTKSGICQTLPRLRRPLICWEKTDSIYWIPQVLKIVVLLLPSCPEWYYFHEKVCFRFLVSKMSHLSGTKSICAIDGMYEVLWNAWKILPIPSKRDLLCLKILQEHISLNSHCYIATKPVGLEVSVFSVMVFICLSRQTHKFVCERILTMGRLLSLGLSCKTKTNLHFYYFLSNQIFLYFVLIFLLLKITSYCKQVILYLFLLKNQSDIILQ